MDARPRRRRSKQFSNLALASGSLDARAEGAQALVDPLIAPVDLGDVADDRLALGGQGGQQQRHPGADVRRRQPLPVEPGRPVHHGPVGVADDDAGAHPHQLVHEEQPVLEHLLEDQHRAPGLRGHRDRDRGEVGRECRPGSVVDLGDGRAQVVLDDHALVGRQPQRRALQLPGDPEAGEADRDRAHVVLDHALHDQLAAGGGGQPDEARHLDVVRADGVLAAAEALDPGDGEPVGADPADAGPERAEEPAQVLHVGLAGGVADDRLALGEHGRGHGVLGGRHRRLVQEHGLAGEPVGRQLEHPVELDRGPERAEGEQVGVEPAAADHVAPRWGQGAAAGPGQQGPGQQHRGPDAGAQARVEAHLPDPARVDPHVVGADVGELGPGHGGELEHGVHVTDAGHVVEHDRSVGQQGRRDDGQRGVLVAGRSDGAADRLATLDDEALHRSPTRLSGTAAYSTVTSQAWPAAGAARVSCALRLGEAGQPRRGRAAVTGPAYTGPPGTSRPPRSPPMPEFKLVSDMPASGDQPAAVEALVEGLEGGEPALALLGVTGSGKTRTMAGVIERMGRPALVMAPNKTLAAQLTNEFKELFPGSAVEYFVSYYDYYQPEAYIPQTDTYIEKDSSLNEEIDRLRHSATLALLTRRDVIVVASVSAIYGLGSPEEYRDQMLWLKVGEEHDRDGVLRKLVAIHYDRNDLNFVRGKFRVRGDTLEVFPAYEEQAMRVEFFGDEVERILVMDPVTGEIVGERPDLFVFPATHYVASSARMQRAVAGIEAELAERLQGLEREGKLLEAQRLRMRTSYDLEMLREVGFCNGIENYSRHIDGRGPGSPPNTLLDYFPSDFLLFLDESHVTVPQIGGMYEGDRSRKVTLVEHGFRLPSALDNRPLRFDEFLDRIGQRVFVSATPGPYELRESGAVVQQIIRPTGLVDPEVLVRPTKGQIDDLIHEVKRRVELEQRVLVTTLTKKMAEDLTDYLLEMGLRVRYLHSEIGAVERIEILRALRLGEFDTLVGINLLREGLDLPEVTLVAILDADKEGFLRSETSLVQTIGRAARNVDGQVIMYADEVTPSMRRAIDETNRRRKLQIEYNQANGIDPQTIRRRVTDIIQGLRGEEEGVAAGGRPRKGRAPTPARGRAGRRGGEPAVAGMPKDDLVRLITSLEEEMHEAAKDLRFEYAARLRDEVADLRRELRVMTEVGVG